jgi:hypothetical protein
MKKLYDYYCDADISVVVDYISMLTVMDCLPMLIVDTDSDLKYVLGHKLNLENIPIVNRLNIIHHTVNITNSGLISIDEPFKERIVMAYDFACVLFISIKKLNEIVEGEIDRLEQYIGRKLNRFYIRKQLIPYQH